MIWSDTGYWSFSLLLHFVCPYNFFDQGLDPWRRANLSKKRLVNFLKKNQVLAWFVISCSLHTKPLHQLFKHCWAPVTSTVNLTIGYYILVYLACTEVPVAFYLVVLVEWLDLSQSILSSRIKTWSTQNLYIVETFGRVFLQKIYRTALLVWLTFYSCLHIWEWWIEWQRTNIYCNILVSLSII